MMFDYDIPANQVQPEQADVMNDYQITLGNMLNAPGFSTNNTAQANKPQLTGGERNNEQE